MPAVHILAINLAGRHWHQAGRWYPGEKRNIRYDEVVLVDRFDAKAEVIAEHRVSVYIDDQPEMLKHIPAGVHVMLFRNEGNYDFEDFRWMFSSQTGKQVC